MLIVKEGFDIILLNRPRGARGIEQIENRRTAPFVGPFDYRKVERASSNTPPT